MPASRVASVKWPRPSLRHRVTPPPFSAVSKLSGKKRGVEGWKRSTGWK